MSERHCPHCGEHVSLIEGRAERAEHNYAIAEGAVKESEAELAETRKALREALPLIHRRGTHEERQQADKRARAALGEKESDAESLTEMRAALQAAEAFYEFEPESDHEGWTQASFDEHTRLEQAMLDGFRAALGEET